MTPQEKAEELVNKYLMNTPVGFHIDDAKECALIAVDEMILVLPYTNTNLVLNEYSIQLHRYLEQVKQEIEKL